jgi:hypothetical protein
MRICTIKEHELDLTDGKKRIKFTEGIKIRAHRKNNSSSFSLSKNISQKKELILWPYYKMYIIITFSLSTSYLPIYMETKETKI